MRRLKKSSWPVSVQIKLEKFHSDWYLIEAWLEQNVGRFRYTWNLVERNKNLEYYFKNEADAVLFTLRWS